jgi:hypothetical protein
MTDILKGEKIFSLNLIFLFLNVKHFSHFIAKSCRICKRTFQVNDEITQMFCGCKAHVDHYLNYKSKYGAKCPIHGPDPDEIQSTTSDEPMDTSCGFQVPEKPAKDHQSK